MIQQGHAWLVRHAGFIQLWLLAVSFRLLALLLFRPGGFITDFSDYDFYYTWGTLVPMGYRAYDNLWTAYPPLFPLLMLTVFEWAARIPPWLEPRLFFHLLFGTVMLLFDAANLLLIGRLAARLAQDLPPDAQSNPPAGYSSLPVASVAFYALCFVPVYTLLGWFEPMPLFFLLLGLELLFVPRPWGWGGSAVAAGLGFLTKLTPILLLPVAVRWLGARLSWQALRSEWFNRRARGNLLRPTLYTLIFAGVVVSVGYPLVRANLGLALSSLRIQSIRPPWQSLWAVLDGFYDYGLVPLDMRNLVDYQHTLWESRLPWGLIGLGFALVYLWLYTRAYDWTRIRTPIALTGSSVILLFLYSKGWSPQFLLWVLVFMALLMPTVRGAVLAILLSLVNFVEANLFLILLPNEHWIMVGTVLTRTLLLSLIAVEFMAQIWPAPSRVQRVRRLAAGASWVVVGMALLGAGIGAPRAAQAYWAQQTAAHPCRTAIDYLLQEAGGPNRTVVTQQPEVWRDLYPWLRADYTFQVIDGYSAREEAAEVAFARAQAIGAGVESREFWWISRDDQPESPTSPWSVRTRYLALPAVTQLEERIDGACRLDRVLDLQGLAPLATAAVAGGPIALEHAALQVGDTLQLVLYWRAQSPVTARYTVFTQLFDPTGQLVAQQDNWPVMGLAPTDSWQPGIIVRDPYILALPDQAPAGDYQLWVGLYDSAGRQTLTLPTGEQRDHLVLPVRVGVQD
jgi:hypothetical protein